ncbi:MAG: DbpA RNA binding domain-containing protein [Methylococcales bacterium]|nr:DbpA RNA binding domain-containing protein [Methylococcales bacterium]
MHKQPQNNQEQKLKNGLKTILAKGGLDLHQALIQQLSTELHVSVLECAAALLMLNKPHLYRNNTKPVQAVINTKAAVVQKAKQKLVRYRLDIGRKHQIVSDEIKKVLVEVSGVDEMRIGQMDIRHHYTLVDLPDGMSADIFQLLSETEVNKQCLNIKRVKSQRRFQRRIHNKSSSKT